VPFAVGLADEKELESLYGDWKVLESKSYTFEDEHTGSSKQLYASNMIVAKRKG